MYKNKKYSKQFNACYFFYYTYTLTVRAALVRPKWPLRAYLVLVLVVLQTVILLRCKNCNTSFCVALHVAFLFKRCMFYTLLLLLTNML